MELRVEKTITIRLTEQEAAALRHLINCSTADSQCDFAYAVTELKEAIETRMKQEGVSAWTKEEHNKIWSQK